MSFFTPQALRMDLLTESITNVKLTFILMTSRLGPLVA